MSRRVRSALILIIARASERFSCRHPGRGDLWSRSLMSRFWLFGRCALWAGVLISSWVRLALYFMVRPRLRREGD